MEIFNGPPKLGKVLLIPLPYDLLLFYENVLRTSSKGIIWEITEEYNGTLKEQLWVRLIFDVLKLIHSYHIRIMNVCMGPTIIDMIQYTNDLQKWVVFLVSL